MAKSQWEEDTISRFIDFLKTERNVAYGISARDYKLPSGKDFDYELQDQQGNKLAVEIFRLVGSEEELAQDSLWGKLIHNLRQILTARGIKGVSISTPRHFDIRGIPKKTFYAETAEQIAQAIQNDPSAQEINTGGYTIRKIPDFEHIFFSSHISGRSVDPSQTALDSLQSKLPKKNEQLKIDNHERILLIHNWAMFVSDKDMINALTTFDFRTLNNIDKIFYEEKNHNFVLVFDRGVFDAIQTSQPLRVPELQSLVSDNIRYRLRNNGEDTFSYIKKVTYTTGNMFWLSDKYTREEVVRYAQDLADKGLLENAMFVIRHLKNDPDPQSGDDNLPDQGSGDSDYHAQIARGEEVSIITTVKGNLCWLMLHVISQNKPEYYTEIIDILESYAMDKNLYIRTQVVFPLRQLLANRRATKNRDETPFNWDWEERKHVRQLAFKLLRGNKEYPRVMHSVLSLFDILRDVNESEAEEILETFINYKEDYIQHDLAALVVYFALFREKDFVSDGKFNGDKFKQILVDQIQNGNPAMKETIAWHFWHILSIKALSYDNIKVYLPLFWNGQYKKGIASKYDLLLEEILIAAPDDAIKLYVTVVDKTYDYLVSHQNEARDVWFDISEQMLPMLIKEPNVFLQVLEKLVQMHEWGMPYIGEIKSIFESYQYIELPTDKERVKAELQRLYPRVYTAKQLDIDWNK